MRNSKAALAGIVGLALITATLLAIFNLKKNPQQLVTINAPENSKVQLYTVSDSENPLAFKDGDLIATGQPHISQQLQKGSYAYKVMSSDSAYQDFTDIFDVVNEPVTLTPSLAPTKPRLNQITLMQKNNVIELLNKKYDFVIKNYTIDNISALGDGSWIGARLNPVDSSSDVYIVLFRIKDSQLEIVTDPPSIVIAKPVYPDIPDDVITGVNKLSSN